ncbi:hypothetical protein COV49_00900 [Candidatus Falkowbacteria bacterium CG11_big_fil_rev_8_21_14_0_20_39_10]|uniref:Uncharacterized protein n=1 Tax=Candidatus Falkowbacteria bacterium CG11_big_fil_rev_8_21_14_0_20_39_10 TaxID=1974570 RepID=A0A2M6KA19_9BACT|nr:MAG: hypothetical protein COV49_00900 [Candidatus Falkowbacteria bacterium CG11_big_fil_rev_8_21_14_0_20_39_10]
MNRKALGILIILVGLIIIAGIIYFIFFYNSNKEEVESQPLPVKQTEESVQTENKLPEEKTSLPDVKKPATAAPIQRDVNGEELKRMAGSFAERFGSYSNHSSYSNIYDLQIFMSENMKSWADKFVSDARAKQKPGDIYYGISTRAIHEEINNFDDEAGRAEIIVNTQRRESTGTMGNNNTFYQDVSINFIKENSLWKVDSAYWADK